MKEILVAENISKQFKRSAKQRKAEKTRETMLKAVDQVSFTAYQGEIFGLLGPNGAGKTTTLRMLATLIRPDSGDARIHGYSVVSSPEQVRQNIGFLTSELKLEDFFTPSYLFDFFAGLHHVPQDVCAKRKQEMFERFGIDRFAHVKVADLSTGMKQKASLVVSMAHDPDFIIFDEPTNGLDVVTARVVTDYLKELRKEGKTILLSTHIFDLVEKLCDRVGILIGGRMADCGTLQQVCGGQSMEDRFFELYERTAEAK